VRRDDVPKKRAICAQPCRMSVQQVTLDEVSQIPLY
jgi:hypothetical protein